MRKYCILCINRTKLERAEHICEWVGASASAREWDDREKAMKWCGRPVNYGKCISTYWSNSNKRSLSILLERWRHLLLHALYSAKQNGVLEKNGFLENIQTYVRNSLMRVSIYNLILFFLPNKGNIFHILLLYAFSSSQSEQLKRRQQIPNEKNKNTRHRETLALSIFQQQKLGNRMIYRRRLNTIQYNNSKNSISLLRSKKGKRKRVQQQ